MPKNPVIPTPAPVIQRAAPSGPAWTQALADGFDMSLVELSLQKTPWERLLEHDAALQFAAALRNATKKAHAKS